MKKILTLAMIAAVFTLGACKKKKIEKEPEKPAPVRLLTRVWGQDSFSGPGSGTSEKNSVYTYDVQNRLIKISEVGSETTEITYKDDLITQVEHHFSSSTAFSISKYTYENGKPKSSSETLYREPGVIRGESSTNFIYTDGKITAVESISEGKVTGIKKFTYSGDNIDTYTKDNGYVLSYKYDDKKNPYFNKELKLLMRSTDHFSANNATEVVTVPFPNVKITDSYVFTYDAEGYPITMKSPDGKSVVRNFEYTTK